MVRSLEADKFLEEARRIPAVDVRSPGEFLQGHIPGAINIPLFNDEERASVGIVYKNSGPEAAVLRGLDLAGPQLSGYVKKLHSQIRGKEVLLYCWRGGMRSGNMAWLFSQAGYSVSVLAGGYKTYRRYIRSALSVPLKIIVIGGYTGSGKTEVLQMMRKHGKQVLDLEDLACHKGSVFGAFGQKKQPTNEQFENDIYAAWSQFNLNLPVWVEDESRSIGNVNIPDPLFKQMSGAALIRIEPSREIRIGRLVAEYAQYSKEELKSAVAKIRDKIGDRLKIIHIALDRDDFTTVADVVLHYYDKAYEHSISRRSGPIIATIPVDHNDPEAIVQDIRSFLKDIPESSNLFQHGADLS
jgi:tRNA 2-selenouridine synthase